MSDEMIVVSAATHLSFFKVQTIFKHILNARHRCDVTVIHALTFWGGRTRAASRVARGVVWSSRTGSGPETEPARDLFRISSARA